MSTNHLSSFPLPSERVQSSCPYSLIMASHGLPCQRPWKSLTLFLFLAIIGAPRMDAFPPVFLRPQRVPQTLPGHMVTTGKRGHKTIYIPGKSAGNVWKSIQISAFNSFASVRSWVRIPSGPPFWEKSPPIRRWFFVWPQLYHRRQKILTIFKNYRRWVLILTVCGFAYLCLWHSNWYYIFSCW